MANKKYNKILRYLETQDGILYLQSQAILINTITSFEFRVKETKTRSLGVLVIYLNSQKSFGLDIEYTDIESQNLPGQRESLKAIANKIWRNKSI